MKIIVEVIPEKGDEVLGVKTIATQGQVYAPKSLAGRKVLLILIGSKEGGNKT